MTWLRRLPVLGEIAARLGATSAKSAARLEAGELEALGESYIAATRRHRRTKHPFFTDKMPANWQHIGLIKLALPRAKIRWLDPLKRELGGRERWRKSPQFAEQQYVRR